jgi:carboxymethylenebutenolidase
VLIQEIFGVTAHIRAVADQYALDGYVVLAPDLFWRAEPQVDLGYGEADWTRAFELMKGLDFGLAIGDLDSALKTLRGRVECSGKVASIGYCMGGLLSYLCAASTDVDAAVCYYPGSIDAHLVKADKVNCPILLHFAEQDSYIPAQAVQAVRGAFAGSPQATIEVYPGVDHGFNCWERPMYDQRSAAIAHGRTLTFLADAL